MIFNILNLYQNARPSLVKHVTYLCHLNISLSPGKYDISVVTLLFSLPQFHKDTPKLTDVSPDAPVETWRKDNIHFLNKGEATAGEAMTKR